VGIAYIALNKDFCFLLWILSEAGNKGKHEGGVNMFMFAARSRMRTTYGIKEFPLASRKAKSIFVQ
jgi:hypothetical protein